MLNRHLMIITILAAEAAPAFAASVPPPKIQTVAPPAAAPASASPKPITRAEFIADFQKRFSQADTNHDGILDASEVAAAQERGAQALRTREQQQLEAEFNRLDTNRDGQLSKAEFMAAAKPVQMRETPQQFIARFDTNHDGKVSLQEYEAVPLANFGKLDKNHDGTITPQELQAARAAARKR